MKVLLSAYGCEPGLGSEPGVGWNWVKKISRFHKVWVITRANNREVINEALAKDPVPNAHFVYYDLPYWLRFWKKKQRGIQLYYYLWQAGIYPLAQRLHKEIGFDLVHHVTFVVYWKPSFLSLLPVPFIWGPVGGGESAPRSFWKEFSLRGKIYESVRELARSLAELDPFIKTTARKAAFSFATTTETQERIEALGANKVEVLSQVALPLEEIEHLGAIPIRNSKPFRAVSIGRLMHLKGPALALKAFALFNRRFPESEFWFIGDGPEKGFLEKLAKRLEIKDKITFWGQLPREETLQKLGGCDVLLFPSLHDSGGYVCAEAMAAGRPVVCLNLGGPGLQVTEETGFKVPAISPEQAIKDMADALYRLATDTPLKMSLAEGGKRRVEKMFNWGTKTETVKRCYLQAINIDFTKEE